MADYQLKSIHQENVTRILEQGATTVTLAEQQIGDGLKLGCWFSGTAMVFSGIFCCFANLGAKLSRKLRNCRQANEQRNLHTPHPTKYKSNVTDSRQVGTWIIAREWSPDRKGTPSHRNYPNRRNAHWG